MPIKYHNKIFITKEEAAFSDYRFDLVKHQNLFAREEEDKSAGNYFTLVEWTSIASNLWLLICTEDCLIDSIHTNDSKILSSMFKYKENRIQAIKEIFSFTSGFSFEQLRTGHNSDPYYVPHIYRKYVSSFYNTDKLLNDEICLIADLRTGLQYLDTFGLFLSRARGI